MTGAQVRAARTKLGLSQAGLARALDLRGAAAWQTVSEWENGKRDVPGPAARLLKIWTDRRCPDWAKPEANA